MIIAANSTFQNLVSWTDGHDSFLTLLLAAVVAITTIAYAGFTWKLVSETIKMRKVQTEPHISITMQPREDKFGLIDMVVQNIGLGPAYNIRFDITTDFELLTNKQLSDIGFFKNGIQYFAPNDKRQFFLANAYQKYDELMSTKIQITAKYNNGAGTNYSSPYIIDFSEFENLISVGESPISEIANSLDKMKSDIHNIAGGNSKLKIINYTEDGILQKNAELREDRNSRSNENVIKIWKEKREFRYKGSVKDGTQVIVEELEDENVMISSLQYYDLLSKFRGKTVNIGLPDSNNEIPDDSLGSWLRDNVRRIPLAAYVGPILVKEGYAEKGDDVAFITFKQEYPTDS